MFKEQRKAAGYFPGHLFRLFELKLAQAGYEEHNGPRTNRDGEVLAARAAFDGRDGLRQNHVQVVDRGTVFAAYAHTEPHTDRLIDHAISAINDDASFAGGSKMLRNNLAAVGFRLMTYVSDRSSALMIAPGSSPVGLDSARRSLDAHENS